MTTITTLSKGSTYIRHSQSVSQITNAEMITMTDPRASAIKCKNTPRIFIYQSINTLDP